MHMGRSHPFASRQSRHSSSSFAASPNVGDVRRSIFRKENQFVDRYGSKLHAYDRDKAPYPCSFDRDVIELCVPTRSRPSVARLRMLFSQAMSGQCSPRRHKRLSFFHESRDPSQTMSRYRHRRTRSLFIARLHLRNEIPQLGLWVVSAAKMWPDTTFVCAIVHDPL